MLSVTLRLCVISLIFAAKAKDVLSSTVAVNSMLRFKLAVYSFLTPPIPLTNCVLLPAPVSFPSSGNPDVRDSRFLFESSSRNCRTSSCVSITRIFCTSPHFRHTTSPLVTSITTSPSPQAPQRKHRTRVSSRSAISVHCWGRPTRGPNAMVSLQNDRAGVTSERVFTKGPC